MPLGDTVPPQTENIDESPEGIPIPLTGRGSDFLIKTTGDHAISLLENTGEVLTNREKEIIDDFVKSIRNSYYPDFNELPKHII